MIDPKQIPDAVVEAAAKAVCRIEYGDELGWDVWIGPAEHAIAAALAAWPGAKPAWFLPQGKVYMLPAPWENKGPQESSNDA